MNVEIGTEAKQFPEKEYMNGIFLAVCVYPHLGCPICSRSCKISNSQFQVAINHAQTQVMVNRSHPGHGQPLPPRSRSTVPTQVTAYQSILRSRSTSVVPGYGQPAHPRSWSSGLSYVMVPPAPITGSSPLMHGKRFISRSSERSVC
jgi:hypothetical protein